MIVSTKSGCSCPSASGRSAGRGCRPACGSSSAGGRRGAAACTATPGRNSATDRAWSARAASAPCPPANTRGRDASADRVRPDREREASRFRSFELRDDVSDRSSIAVVRVAARAESARRTSLDRCRRESAGKPARAEAVVGPDSGTSPRRRLSARPRPPGRSASVSRRTGASRPQRLEPLLHLGERARHRGRSRRGRRSAASPRPSSRRAARRATRATLALRIAADTKSALRVDFTLSQDSSACRSRSGCPSACRSRLRAR